MAIINKHHRRIMLTQGYVPLSEGAKVSGINTRTMYRLLESGHLLYQFCGSTRFVQLASIWRYLNGDVARQAFKKAIEETYGKQVLAETVK